MKNNYRLVETPGYTAIEFITSGERLVTIHTKHKDGSFLSEQDMNARKAFVLKVFNSFDKR